MYDVMPPRPHAAGVLYALLAALSFGATTPVIARKEVGLGPLSVAALLYLGAAIASAVACAVGAPSGVRLDRGSLLPLLGMAGFGAALAPVLLAMGLARAGALSGSLVLGLEAVFTVGLAAAVLREPVGRRVGAALGLLLSAGALVTLDGARSSRPGSWLGLFAIAAATLCWAIDNTLSRRVSDRDPSQVVLVKAALGATLTGALALARGEPAPAPAAALWLVGAGATGYGASLRLYLLAQRRVGAARTGAVFSTAPLIGASLAWALGERDAGWMTASGALLLLVGLWLHATEPHAHGHVHEPLAHAHAHRHDDGHHTHAHDPEVEGEHSHAHEHPRVEHDHAHAPDLHHDHHGPQARSPPHRR